MSSLKADGRFDVIVVGGGVNGIGVYRDLSLQGLRVLLVERNDFCSGCSAAPSRMIHGGLRYLENGEFDLVRESLKERDLLLRNAPHMVSPIATLIPITSVFSGLFNGAASFLGWPGRPASRGALAIKLGLTLYDRITGRRRLLPRHKFNGGAATRACWPEIRQDARFSAVYYDAWISHPERLCIEMLKDTRRANAACIALNYSELVRDRDGMHLRCLGTNSRFDLSADAIVNATGAWLDATAAELGSHPGEQMVSGTKGSHLVIDNRALKAALRDHMVYFENTDGRVCIACPYLGHVLAGSTDIRVPQAGQVRCEEDELEYILASLRRVFPGIPVTRDEILFTYSGIRPLPRSDHGFTGRISRGHFTRRLDGSPPQFCMVGGKWTTFRAFAEQTADEVLAELGRSRKRSTADLPIGGGAGLGRDGEALVAGLLDRFDICAARAGHLVDHYGSEAEQVARFCQAQHDDEPLVPGLVYSSGEIDWLIAQEYVESIADIVLRRSALAITGAVSTDIIDRIAARFARARGLTPAQTADQIRQLIDTLYRFHGVSRATLEKRNHDWRKKCA